jgi:hypothetical protein
LLRPQKNEALASVFFSFLVTGFVVLLYNLDPARSWMSLVGIWAVSEAVILYLLQNQRKNEKKFRRHPVAFPNPEGGGIVGQYMMRPWQNELTELEQRYPRKKKRHQKKED